MRHIERKELYTSLEKRLEYFKAFIGWDHDDEAALALAAKPLVALVPAVVNIVYKKLLSFDITARAFSTRSTSYEGPLDDYPSLDSPQIQYRKMFLRGYLRKLCSDPSKIEYWQYLDKVGMMHVGQGRKHPLHIEFIHMGALLGYVGDILIEAVLSHPKLTLTEKTAVVRALNKLLWIQNDLFAKWYVRDGEEFRKEADETARDVEPEGYLNGKPIIEADEEAVKAGVCPFSGLDGVVSATGNDKKKGEEASTGGCPFSGAKASE
jgi:hypothetical protein